jgi:hypothetical protein
MKKPRCEKTDELRPEYDLRHLLKGGVRGKYAKRYQAGTNLVLLDPEVRKAFRDGAPAEMDAPAGILQRNNLGCRIQTS